MNIKITLKNEKELEFFNSIIESGLLNMGKDGIPKDFHHEKINVEYVMTDKRRNHNEKN